MAAVDAVRAFWERHPLWVGESVHAAGSREYFEEHRRVYVEDCFAGVLDPRIFSDPAGGGRVLDLGCGPGFWTVEFGLRGSRDLFAADLTARAVQLTRERCRLFGVEARVAQQDAEHLAFASGTFLHVNCLGVIHHTPHTEACLREIARVLAPGGTACVSVYYRNWVLRGWPLLRLGGRLLHRLGAGLRGRGREGLLAVSDVDELVRLYDGRENPIGKSYARRELLALVDPSFRVRELFFHFFPARALPFHIPRRLHRVLDRRIPFMIYATLEKR